MLGELRELENAGQTMYVTALSGEALREQVPLASQAVTAGLNINAQRFVDPRRFVEALGRSVVDRGATMHRLEIRDILTSGSGVAVYPRRGKPLDRRRRGDRHRRTVVAAGGPLAARAGAGRSRLLVYRARGPPDNRPHLPAGRAGGVHALQGRDACFGHHGIRPPTRTARHTRRVEAIVASASPLLDGARWAERSNMWVGACPVTPDGRPLIGEVSPGVYMAGGHGMWGLAHGPMTGRLLAEQITTGKQPQALRRVRSAAQNRP